jgi:hypothetical protein
MTTDELKFKFEWNENVFIKELNFPTIKSRIQEMIQYLLIVMNTMRINLIITESLSLAWQHKHFSYDVIKIEIHRSTLNQFYVLITPTNKLAGMEYPHVWMRGTVYYSYYEVGV